MASIESNKVTNVEVQNETNTSTSQVITTNNDQNPNTSTVAKVDEETMVSTDLFAYDPAKYSFCKQNSIVNTLTVGEVGTLEIQAEIRKGVYGITLWPERDYDKYFEQIYTVIPEATLWKNRRPNIGDFAFGQRLDTDWIRGYVVSLIPYLKMAMIDQARIVIVLRLATCKPPLSDMHALGGLCELTDATHELKEGQELEFKVIGQTDNEEQDGFEILILNGDYELKATVKPWIPTLEQVGIPCGDVTNGCEVCITGYRNHIHLFVRPLDALGLARYNFVMEAIAKCAETSPFLKEPNIGDSVLAMTTDGKYYRAHVVNADEDGVEVMFHDLGRREFVDPEKIKAHPDSLEEIGYFMSKVKLQGIPPDIPPLKDIVDLLDNLVETKVPLLCTFDGIPSTDGVYLTFRDGETLNNMICKCIESNCVKPSK